MESLAKLVVMMFLVAMMISLASGILISTVLGYMIYKLIAIGILQVLLYYFSPFPIQVNYIFSLSMLTGFLLAEYFI